MATATYEHSNVFASLKRIDEQLHKNLTTSQYLQVYDDYLDNAVIPIIAGTKYFDIFLVGLLGWQEKNFRRKVSLQERGMVASKILSFLFQSSLQDRVEAYKKIQLDRGVITRFLRSFQEKCDPYIRACNLDVPLEKGEEDQRIAKCLYIKQSLESELSTTLPLMAIYRESSYWSRVAENFKGVILEKYVRLCLVEAKKDYELFFECRVKLDDIIHTYLVATSRAIDKCDSRQGALTSHIRNWLLTGRTRVQEQLDKDSRRESSIELEGVRVALEYQSDMVQTDTDRMELIRYLGALADKNGAARAYLNIG